MAETHVARKHFIDIGVRSDNRSTTTNQLSRNICPKAEKVKFMPFSLVPSSGLCTSKEIKAYDCEEGQCSELLPVYQCPAKGFCLKSLKNNQLHNKTYLQKRISHLKHRELLALFWAFFLELWSSTLRACLVNCTKLKRQLRERRPDWRGKNLVSSKERTRISGTQENKTNKKKHNPSRRVQVFLDLSH